MKQEKKYQNLWELESGGCDIYILCDRSCQTGFCVGYGFEENMTVYVSPYEHNAVMRTLEAIKEKKKNLR